MSTSASDKCTWQIASCFARALHTALERREGRAICKALVAAAACKALQQHQDRVMVPQNRKYSHRSTCKQGPAKLDFMHAHVTPHDGHPEPFISICSAHSCTACRIWDDWEGCHHIMNYELADLPDAGHECDAHPQASGCAVWLAQCGQPCCA